VYGYHICEEDGVLMRGYFLSRRFPILIVSSLVLFSIVVGALSMQVGRLYAAHITTKHSVSINPRYLYAEQAAAARKFKCQTITASARCYGPVQMRTAYSIQPLLDTNITGKGSTIVILDAFQSPSLVDDLRLFDKNFGLPDPTLSIISPVGALTPFDPSNATQVGWSGEISLDVEWAHATAPDANIDLVLAKSDQDGDLTNALNYAVDQNLGDVISLSFGENETCLDPSIAQAWHTAFYNASREGITVLSSSGDIGASQGTCDNTSDVLAVSQPAIDPLVTAVGGAQLDANLVTGAYSGEVAWNEPAYQVASGGGFSTLTHKPSYQYNMSGIGSYRGIPDVAYNAAINGGVLVAWSSGPHGPRSFYVFGGTSAGAPQWAGIIALGVQLGKQRLGFINPSLYTIGHSATYSSAFHDITTGTNTISLTDSHGNPIQIQGYKATSGWDATTGWGSPIVDKLLPMLVKLVGSPSYKRHP
jgi:subtilase family serine protease